MKNFSWHKDQEERQRQLREEKAKLAVEEGDEVYLGESKMNISYVFPEEGKGSILETIVNSP